MTKEKKQIVLIYSGVAVMAIVLIFLFSFVAEVRNKQAAADEKDRQERLAKVQVVETVRPLTQLDKKLTEDLKGTNQNGEAVGLYDLKGKVVVFAQFYSRCSMCLGHNRLIMQDLHETLKDDPKVHFVTVTVDPDFDTPAKLKEMAKQWNADASSWWMMNVPHDRLAEYCRKQMWYVDYKENEEATSIADAIQHDMGIAVIDGNSTMLAKVNLFELKANDKEEMYQIRKGQLLDVIRNAEKGME